MTDRETKPAKETKADPKPSKSGPKKAALEAKVKDYFGHHGFLTVTKTKDGRVHAHMKHAWMVMEFTADTEEEACQEILEDLKRRPQLRRTDLIRE